MRFAKLTAFLAATALIVANVPGSILTVRAENSGTTQYVELSTAETKEEAAAIEGEEYLTEETTIEKMAVVYLTDYYGVKEAPSTDAAEVISVPSGQTVIVEECDIYNGEAWFQVRFYVNEVEYQGYIQEQNLAYSDERLIQWKQESLAGEPDVLAANERAVSYADIEQFPTSYQGKLKELKQAHPSWVFVKMNTGLNWSDVVYNESNPASRSLVPDSSPTAWKNGYHSPGWSYASEGILKYYLDPRNFLEEREIFQFEQLTYNASYHTQAAVQSFLNRTFMAGNAPDGSGSYAAMFTGIGAQLGVSPFHLASRVYQEQGAGTSPLISGTYAGYEGYYNYFNVGASGSTNKEVIVSGLERAKKEGWNSVYASIYGGAQVISKSYILKGQDTIYLQKFDVDNQYSGMYWHQYMQNICAPTSEAYSIYNLYNNTNSVDNTFVFKIPVYENMPENACGKPLRYNDVSTDAWYYDYVSYVYTQKLMSGKDVNIFAPEDQLTRAEFATILYNAAGKPEVSYSAIFADVPDGQWYTDAILWANQVNIVNGYDTGMFGTTDVVTREQLVLMLKKFGMYEGRDMGSDSNVLNTFGDYSSVSTWAKDAMAWAVTKGIISGKDNHLLPQGGATRAEAATILYHYMALGYADIAEKDMVYPDRVR